MEKLIFQHQLAKYLEQFKNNKAVEYGNHEATYVELDRRSNYIANALLHKSVAPKNHIGIYVEDRMRLITIIIGILKAGCVFVPLDRTLPSKRLERMTRIADLKWIIGDNHGSFDSSTGANVYNWAENSSYIPVEELFPGETTSCLWFHTCPSIEYNPEDEIYIYFTSGTSGEPKAIVGKNKSLTHFIHWEIETFGIDHSYRISQFITPGFDAFLRDVFVPLFAGGVLCIPGDRDIILKAEELIGWTQTHRIHLMHGVPSFFKLISSSPLKPWHFRDLRYVLLSGEKINPKDLVNWYETFGDKIRIINLYGPTETTMIKTYYPIQPLDVKRERIPVGKPIKGSRVIILDKNMKICDKKETGEIYIRTPFMTHGYYNAPDLNAEKFISNPFSSAPTDIIFKTGDLGRFLMDGDIELLGRIDRQVKLRGIRIELEEIENILMRHPRILEAVVVKKELSGNENLFAYVVEKGNSANPGEIDCAAPAHPDVENLKDYLSRNLPEYVVPAHILKLKKLPRKPNGKIDYDALPHPFRDEREGYIPPRDNIEKKLQEIWGEPLGLSLNEIGIESSFFDLGGNSLNVMSLIAKIHKGFDLKLTLADIFRNPSIMKQAEKIRELNKGEVVTQDKYTAIDAEEKMEYYLLSSAQKRLYILQQMGSDFIGYNNPVILELEGALQKHRLESTLKKVIARHDSLRTSFIIVDGVPVQVIHRQTDFSLNYRQAHEEEVPGILEKFVRVFDLSTAPIFRVGIIKVGDERHILMYDMHHIITDGISDEIFVREFMEIYDGSELASLRLQYKDYAGWQQRPHYKEGLNRQQEYWLAEFCDEIPMLQLPTDYPRPLLQDFEGDILYFLLGKEETAGLKGLCEEYQVTLYMLLLAVFDVLLFKLSGQEDIVVGSPVAGRRHADLEPIIGMLVNTLAIRCYPSSGKTFNRFLQEVKSKTLSAFENQEYPFEYLVEKLKVSRDLGRNPLFDVMFSLQNMEIEELEITGLKLKPYGHGNKISKFDLTLTGEESNDTLRFKFEYCTRLFKRETIERYEMYFRQVIASVIRNSRQTTGEIDLLTGSEMQQVLYDFNDSARDFPGDKLIHEIFEEKAAHVPDRAVLVDIEGSKFSGCELEGVSFLTNRELNIQADHLAQKLQKLGIISNNVVGLMTARSLSMVIGILAILKTGASYLPLDPGYPAERLRYLLADSGANVLVTTAALAEDEKVREYNGETILIPPEMGLTPPAKKLTIGRRGHSPAQLCYILYTSGSAGAPKGVMVKHKSLVNILHYLEQNYPLKETDAFMQKTTYTFDVSLTELFGWIFGKGRLVLPGENVEKDPRAIARQVWIHRVTHINFVPSIFSAFVNWLQGHEGHELFSAKLSDLKYIFLAGESIQPGSVRTLREKCPHITLENIYGPTEASIYVTRYSLEDWNGLDNIPIGRAVANMKVYILDTHNSKPGQVQGIGIPGELCVSGVGTAVGYLNRPELTSEKFGELEVKVKVEPGKDIYHWSHKSYTSNIIYKTGDLARWLPDGNIQLLGRIDQQIKIRGFRIELGEIETWLLKHEDIKEAVVIALKGNDGKGNSEDSYKYLCAYITAKSKLSQSQMRDFLALHLPDYLIPAYFHQLDRIPLTPSGKVDRRNLPTPGVELNKNYILPSTRNEKLIAEAWKEILSLENVGLHDNFFELGGNSLLCIHAIHRLGKIFEREIPIVAMFKYMTIHSFSRYLEQGTETGSFSYQDRPEKLEQGKNRMTQSLKIMRKR